MAKQQHTLSGIGLTQAETTLVQTIIRLSSNENVQCWDWVLDPEDASSLDALLIGGNIPPDPHLLAKARHRLCLGAPSIPPSLPYDVLPRPIKAEGLVQWISSKALDDNNHALITHTLLHAENNRAQAPAAVNAQEFAPASPVKPSASTHGTAIMQFKLRHWPSANIIGHDPVRIRMATMLTKRPMHVGLLAAMSGQEHKICAAFMDELHAQNLLEASRPADPATAQSHAEAPRPATPINMPNHVFEGMDHSLLRHLSTSAGRQQESSASPVRQMTDSMLPTLPVKKPQPQ